jgi:3-methylfumaryl-CoA hydratase
MSEVIERTELLAPEPATALAGLLDVPVPDLEAGEGLPLTWHWLYLLERPLQRDLGEDGHPVRDAMPAPPGPGRHRMWAGGSVRNLATLHVGEPATRRSRVLDTIEKHGHSGRLTFVTVGHTILQRGEVVVEEQQEILYRDAATEPVSSDAEVETRDRLEVGQGEWSVPVDPALLFRFSALTYNAHRIHYDRDYARTHEGYPGLVVHGPLQAMVMAEAARSRGVMARPGEVFEYRLVAPLYEGQGLVARASEHDGGMRTTVRDDWGRRTAEGHVS